MKIILLVLLMMVLFIVGCTMKTTGNIIIEDAIKQPAEEKKETTTTTIQETKEPEKTTTTTVASATTTTTILGAGNLINIENLKFVPDKLTVAKGTTVTWKHNDQYIDNMKHMIRIYPIGVASPQMYYGESFSYTFNESGEYTIIDIIYKEKNVRGKVSVE